MPDWGEVLAELGRNLLPNGTPDHDRVRRGYLAQLAAHTDRDVILYATRWTEAGGSDPSATSITEEDIHGLMAVFRGLRSRKLDLIIHSPGGSAEAAEAMVQYLRSRFDHIRAIVPQAAMSAATMVACAADEIVMGAHSSLGPIDPQMIVASQSGSRAIPAQAILDQFSLARKECRDPKLLGAWLPMLSQYGPALLIQCSNALALSEDLVCEWLKTWMFAGRKNAGRAARTAAKTLRDHQRFKSHGRHIGRAQARSIGLKVVDLEDDKVFQDLALSVFHATTHTFSQRPVAKIIENQNGKAYVKVQQQLQINLPFPIAPQAPPPSTS